MKLKKKPMKRPIIGTYHHLQALLSDWLAYLEGSQSSTRLTDLSQTSQLSVSYLSMIFQGKRPLTERSLKKLSQALGWSKEETEQVANLMSLNQSKKLELQSQAFEKIAKKKIYQKLNPEEAAIYEYLAKWYYVAIRELATTPGFKNDAEWIQSRLWKKVGKTKINAAIDFLLSKNFLSPDEKGNIIPPERSLECEGKIYALALKKFYQQMGALAQLSIDQVESEKRLIKSYTLSIDQAHFLEITKILDEAYEKIKLVSSNSKSGEEVYHASFSFFPLTLSKKQKISNSEDS